jgi:hypothetical protein
MIARAAMSAKNRLPPVLQKFNTFNTFNTFAIFNPPLEYPRTSRVRGVSERAVSTSNPPLPSETGEGVGGEGQGARVHPTPASS